MKLTLPVGVTLEGQVLRDFTLAPVTGKLRVALNDAPMHMPGIDMCALRHVIKSLGHIDGVYENLFRRLTIPDRDYIHAAVSASRHNGNIPVHGTCDCGEKLTDSVAADAIALIDADAPIQWEDGRACVALEVNLPESGRQVPLIVALPTLALELKTEEARLAKKKSDGDIYVERVADSIVAIDGKTVTAKDLRELPLDDFDAVLEAMDNIKAPRLDNEAVLHCSACGSDITVSIGWDEWVIPLARRMGRKS